MISRLNYLEKEEERFTKRIDRTRKEAEKNVYLKHEKIQALQERINREHLAQLKQQERAENNRLQREKSQAARLANSIERMEKFEHDRLVD